MFLPELADKIAPPGTLVTATLAVGDEVLRLMQAKDALTAEEQRYSTAGGAMRDDNLRQFGRAARPACKFIAGTDAGWRYTPFDRLAEERC